jgi:tyrosine-protein kinase Etk/Wzc
MEVRMDQPASPSVDPSARPVLGSNGPDSSGGNAFWYAAAVLLRQWKVVATITIVTLMLGVAIALLLPRYYAAEARVLQPEGGGIGNLMGMMDRATGGLGRLLVGRGGDFTRYLAVLNSRSLRERMVDEFELIDVYRVARAAHPMQAALDRLDKNLAFNVSLEFNYLGVVAFDRDPTRAAAMANFAVAELNRMNARLSSENARDTRIFVERRLNEALADLDSVRAAMQTFQETHGVVQLESQAQAFMGTMAEMSGRVAELEVRYQTLLTQYGPDNPQVSAARDALSAARRQRASVLGGSDALLPVNLQRLPALSREYAELMQAQLTQAQIIETIYPLFEQAQFQERSEAQAVQVLDVAVPPTKPARPSRRLIVTVLTLTGLLLGCLFALGQSWLHNNHAYVADRLRADGRPLSHS